MIALLVAAAIAAAVSLLGTKLLIGWLSTHRVYQPILSGVEHEAKAGTPTMGGMAIVVAACVGYAVAHLRSGVIFTRTGLLVMARDDRRGDRRLPGRLDQGLESRATSD